MDQALNIGFFVFHTAWMAFTCLGWLWKPTRRWQFGAVLLTALSWFGLGVWYGWGYCPCTDWHWRIRERLGHNDPSSYTQLLIHEVTGVELSGPTSDTLTLVVLVAAGVASAVLIQRDRARGG